jgi:hypothetical protein
MDAYFSCAWQTRLERGPRWLLRRACSHVCARIPTARRVHYEWHLYGWLGERRVLADAVACTNNSIERYKL